MIRSRATVRIRLCEGPDHAWLNARQSGEGRTASTRFFRNGNHAMGRLEWGISHDVTLNKWNRLVCATLGHRRLRQVSAYL